MTAQKARDSERWTATIPDEETWPAGSVECGRKAVAKLGPFRHKLHDEADRLGPREGFNGRIALSEELACERVWILARQYNRQERLGRNAPRSRDVVERLTKLENLAGELARYLESLDDITRHRLQTGGTGISDFCKVVSFPLMEAADVAGLPAPPGWQSDETPPAWVQRLKALSEYANWSLNMFLRSKGIDSVDAPDRGGNTNLHKNLYGSARWAFVSEGWHLYELFKSGKATGTEGGPFHLFLLDVFEYATGLDPEAHSKLVPWIKSVSKANRKYQEILDRERALEKERDVVQSSATKLSPAERLDRIAEISQKLIEVERERYEAWPALFPFSYPQTARQ
jgi:hypothetical protein